MEEKIKILVVDDERDALDLFKDIFEKENYSVECANDGTSALKIVEESNVDVVLLDIRMTPMGGIETLDKLKQIKPKLPVVMLTAYGYDEDLINRAIELGASGYISKSLSLAEIVNTFRTLLSSIGREK